MNVEDMNRRTRAMFVLILGGLFAGCQPDSKPQNELKVIDVTQDYPEKEIFLSEIADINYVQLDETRDDYLYRGEILRSSGNSIIVFNSQTGDVLFFSKDGKPKSRFNRKGNGPGEYMDVFRPFTWYDEETDDFYLKAHNKVDVFSSSGDYKRSFSLPEGTDLAEMFVTADNSMLFFDMSAEMEYTYEYFNIKKERSANADNKEMSFLFARFHSKDGKELERICLPKDYLVNLTLTHTVFGMSISRNAPMNHITKHPDGVLLHTQETDTVFLFGVNKQSLTPVMVQTPSLVELDEPAYLNTFIETNKYQFVEITRLDKEMQDYIPVYLAYDKSNGSIYKQKIILDDFPQKEIFIEPSLASGTQNAHEILIELTVEELMDAYGKNKLKGKLKELVESMNEEAENNILVFLKFQ